MITSTSNELIKSIRKFREKKFRVETGLAYIEGIKLVIDALDQGVTIDKMLISDSFSNTEKRNDIYARVSAPDIESVIVSDEVFQSFSSKENPQGIAAIIRQKWLSFKTLENQFSGLWVGLWEVADPGNLGSIMRTSDAVGAKGIVLIGNCTDPYDPGAIRGSMGAIFANSLVKSDMNTFVNWVSSRGITAIATADSAKTHYREVGYPCDMILVMGSERQGLPPEIINTCRDAVQIPMAGISDSLNLAVATGIVLYEIFEQNKREGSG